MTRKTVAVIVFLVAVLASAPALRGYLKFGTDVNGGLVPLRFKTLPSGSSSPIAIFGCDGRALQAATGGASTPGRPGTA